MTEIAFTRFLNKNLETELCTITTKNESLTKMFQMVLTALKGKL